MQDMYNALYILSFLKYHKNNMSQINSNIITEKLRTWEVNLSKARSHNMTKLGLDSQFVIEDYVLTHYVTKTNYPVKTITTLKWLWNIRENTQHPLNERKSISHIHVWLFSIWQTWGLVGNYNEGLIFHFSCATHTYIYFNFYMYTYFKYKKMSVHVFSSNLHDKVPIKLM